MIKLTAYRHNGGSISGLSAVFDELGGSIGRAETNQFVLPDPDRGISRVHARVEFRGVGGYVLVDNGSNPILVNGQPLGQGREHPLVPGDEVVIGGYAIQVSDATKAAKTTQDPFADMFGDAMVGLAEAPREPVVVRSVTQTWVAQKPESVQASAVLSGGFPDDWDPFADPLPAAPTPLSAQPMSGPGVGQVADADLLGASLDDMFGLARPSAGGDPLGLQPSSSATFTDRNGSELNTPMPRVAMAVSPHRCAEGTSRVQGAPMPAVDSVTPVEAIGLPHGVVLSWDALAPMASKNPAAEVPGRRPDSTDCASSDPMATATSVLLGARSKPVIGARHSSGVAEVNVADRALLPTHNFNSHADADALLSALLQGLSAPGLKLETLTPDTMRLLGELLRESTAGAVGLLLSRAAFKRELRAEQTMIVARENNPLKFSPSAPAALQHLLGPASAGFMAPVAAVRDAFEDLQAHQMAVMAGMKSALEGVLERFDPVHLESQLASRSSVLAGLIPGSRKARLWELFQELFAQLGREAQDNFDELFGRAFVQAYEAQLERVAAAQCPPPSDNVTDNKG